MASTPLATSSAEILGAIDELRAQIRSEYESTTKFRELIAEAEKQQTKATSKYSERTREVRRLRGVLAKSGDKLTGEDLVVAQERLESLEWALTEIDEARPSTGSIFVRAFLGQVNVRAWSSSDRSKLRDEYNKFKDRTNVGFVVLPIIWILTYVYLRHTWRYTAWIHILTHVWLLYYYVSLSLRENILRVNGSHIRNWWIVHHYVSSVMSIAVLTWPADSKSWDEFTPRLTAYFMYQGFVQVFQARYQKARHYARMAMGKAAHMDVVHTETLTEVHAGLYLIVALVFVAQAWQMYLGGSMFRVLFQNLDVTQPWYDFREEIQCFLVGFCFLFLGIVNFVVTVQTLMAKTRSAVEAAAAVRRRRIRFASEQTPLIAVPPSGVSERGPGAEGEEARGASAIGVARSTSGGALSAVGGIRRSISANSSLGGAGAGGDATPPAGRAGARGAGTPAPSNGSPHGTGASSPGTWGAGSGRGGSGDVVMPPDSALFLQRPPQVEGGRREEGQTQQQRWGATSDDAAALNGTHGEEHRDGVAALGAASSADGAAPVAVPVSGLRQRRKGDGGAENAGGGDGSSSSPAHVEEAPVPRGQ